MATISNETQMDIINCKMPRILVNASAGTGKTTVMIERVASQILLGATIDSFLILTFNVKAAEEIRDRLFARLKEEGGQEALNARIAMSTADITNIHKWGIRLLKVYFYKIPNLLPSFRVAEEEEANFIAQQAASEVLESHRDVDPLFTDLADIYARSRKDESLMKRITAIYQFAVSTKSPEGWLDSALQLYINGTDAEKTMSLPYAEKMIELVREFIQVYSRRKRQLNVLDFNDIERFTLQLLQNAEVREELANRYKHVYVDEYQDISELQDEIIETLNADNLFVVGDIKQSIYFFRLCAPEIFVNKRKEYLIRADAKVFNLNENHRSHSDILCFCDEVFSSVMTEEFGGIQYQDESRFNATPLNTNAVTLDLRQPQVNKTVASGLYDMHQASGEDYFQEAHMVAEYILNVIGEEIVIKGEARKVGFGDITILTRSRKKLYYAIYSVLKSKNIPVMCDLAESLAESPIVKMTISVLRCVNNMQDDYALYGALTSRYVGLNEGDVVQLKMAGDALLAGETVRCGDMLLTGTKTTDATFFYQRFFAVLDAYATACVLDSTAINKEVAVTLDSAVSLSPEVLSIIVNFNSLIEGLYTLSASQGVADLLSHLYVSTNILDSVCAYKNGEQFRNDLIDLRDGARGCFASDTLNRFLDYYSESSLKGSERGKVGGYVELSTMHSSKGLEYPVVIYAGAGRKYGNGTGKRGLSGMEMHRNLGFGIKMYDFANRSQHPSSQYTTIYNQNVKSIKEEELRLLYVAFTRAQARMHITGILPTTLKPEKRYPLDFLYYYLTERENKATQAEVVEDATQGEVGEVADATQGEVGEVADATQAEQLQKHSPLAQSQISIASANPKLVQSITQAMQRVYPYNINQPTKLSVTSATQLGIDMDEEYNPASIEALNHGLDDMSLDDMSLDGMSLDGTDGTADKAVLFRGELSPTELGDAYHRAMQFVSADATSEEVAHAELCAMHKEGILSQAELDAVSASKIAKCVSAVKGLGGTHFKEKGFLIKLPINQLFNNADASASTANEDNEVIVQGIIDLLVMDDNGISIVDYKTTKGSEEELAQIYRSQLRAYAHSAIKITQKPFIKAFIYSFVLDKLFSVEI